VVLMTAVVEVTNALRLCIWGMEEYAVLQEELKTGARYVIWVCLVACSYELLALLALQ
jgi:hypothetical protein